MAAQDTTPEAFLSDLAGVQPVNYSDFSDKDKANWVMERNFSAQKGWVLDEASGLLANAGKDYNAGLMESLLRFYDCDPSFTRATKNQGRIIVNNAYLSLLGASTPSCMAGHFNHQRLWDNGWWPRFAILTPEGRPPYQEANGMRRPDDLTNRLQKLITRLPNSTKFPEPPQQLTVGIGSGVHTLWDLYQKATTYDLITENLPDKLHGAYGRLPTHALKVAMILAALDWPENSPAPRIELNHMTKAILITETWRDSVHRAIGTTTETEITKINQRVLKVITSYGTAGVSDRDIYRHMQDKKVAEVN